jgi:hypothetical protein
MAVRSAGHIAGIAARTMSELSSRPNSALSQRSSPSLSLRMRSYDREQVHAQNRQVHFDDVEDTWL